MNITGKLKKYLLLLIEMNERMKALQEATGRVEARQMNSAGTADIQGHEFKVYSQWGEDGIIQYLLDRVPVERAIFVEFGVETYRESNTRFLLTNNNWSGLVLDGLQENIDYIRKDDIYWKHNLKAERAFIDRENINSLIDTNGISGDIGLLSVDIDGNDYWVWKSIDVINPRIVICEYNSIFGYEKEVVIPYAPDFIRSEAHYSNLYWGASIAAFTRLGREKGYALVGSNSAGNNLFFVRNNLMGNLTELTPEQAHMVSQFRESRDEKGNLTLLPFEQRLSVIADMPLIDLSDNSAHSVKALYGH